MTFRNRRKLKASTPFPACNCKKTTSILIFQKAVRAGRPGAAAQDFDSTDDSQFCDNRSRALKQCNSAREQIELCTLLFDGLKARRLASWITLSSRRNSSAQVSRVAPPTFARSK